MVGFTKTLSGRGNHSMVKTYFIYSMSESSNGDSDMQNTNCLLRFVLDFEQYIRVELWFVEKKAQSVRKDQKWRHIDPR